jgi:hypothetical protein
MNISFLGYLFGGLLWLKESKGVTTEGIVVGIILFLFMSCGCYSGIAKMELMNTDLIQKAFENEAKKQVRLNILIVRAWLLF